MEDFSSMERRKEKRKRERERERMRMRKGRNGTKERILGEPWWLGEISLFSDITPVIVMPSNWIRFVHPVERANISVSFLSRVSSSSFRFLREDAGTRLALLRSSSPCSNNFTQYIYLIRFTNRKTYISHVSNFLLAVSSADRYNATLSKYELFMRK